MYEVHQDKAPGLIESIYESCLLKRLGLRRLACVSQKSVLIEYKGFTREDPVAKHSLTLLPVRRPVARQALARVSLSGSQG